MKKRFVLSGYFGFKNFGDEAILSVLVQKLKEDKRNKITIISSNPEYTKSKFKYIRAIKTFDIQNIIEAILKTDYLVSGGGSLLQDVTSLKSLLYYLSIIAIALIFRKKVIIFAQGIGPINNKFGILLTKTILKHCKYISVRDSKSFELLKTWGVESELVCDPIFSTTIPKTEKEPRVAIQLRDFKTMNDDFIDRLAQKISCEFHDKIIDIYSFQDSIDLEVCNKFQKSLNMLNPDIKTNIYYSLNDNEIIEKIAKSEYLIAMRFHAIIIGLLSNVKTLAINYDIKVEKISTEFKLPIIDLNNDITTQFSDLKNQDLENIQKQVSLKDFNWHSFETIITK